MRFPVILFIFLAAAAPADTVTAVVSKQLAITGTPNQMLIFGSDGKLASMPIPSSTQPAVYGMPDGNRVCVATGTAGAYTIPAGVVTLAVYRNGLRASLPGEFTVSGTTMTLATPIADEVVLCDYSR